MVFSRWTTGYKGSRAEYINQDVICLKCGDNIKFIGEDGHQSVYTAPPGESIGPLAIHGINKLFAYSENAIKPRIFVLQYPSFLKVSTLPGMYFPFLPHYYSSGFGSLLK